MGRFREDLKKALRPVGVDEALRRRTMEALREEAARSAVGKAASGRRKGVALLPTAAAAMAGSLATAIVFWSGAHGWQGDPPEGRAPASSEPTVAYAPRDVPDRFELERVIAAPSAPDAAITIRYVSTEGALDVTVTEPTEIDLRAEGFEPIETNGRRRWLKLESDGTLELRWDEGGRAYRLRGALTEEETLRIVSSMEEARE